MFKFSRHELSHWQLVASFFSTLVLVALFFSLTFHYLDIFGSSPDAVLRLLMVPYIFLLAMNFCVCLIVLKQAGKSRATLISLLALVITWLPLFALSALQSYLPFWNRLRPLAICDLSTDELKRAACITEAARDRQDPSLCERITTPSYQDYCKKIFN